MLKKNKKKNNEPGGMETDDEKFKDTQSKNYELQM